VDAADLRLALRVAAAIIKDGEVSHLGSWLDVPVREHMRHATAHLEKALLGVWQGEDELGNAMVRLLMACELRERELAAAQQLAANAEARRAR
jgi:hypothetical protein